MRAGPAAEARAGGEARPRHRAWGTGDAGPLQLERSGRIEPVRNAALAYAKAARQTWLSLEGMSGLPSKSP